MAAAGQQFEALARGRFVLGLGQDAAAHSDDRVAGEHVRFDVGSRLGFFARHSQRVVARQFGLCGLSSMSAWTTRAGSIPRRVSNSRRRGLADARMSEGAPKRLGRYCGPGPPRPGMKR